MKKRGIFFKVFTYTTIFMTLIIILTVSLFSGQFLIFYENNQRQQLYNAFATLHDQLIGKNEEEIIRISEEFYVFNPNFNFYIRNTLGEVIFSTQNAQIDEPETDVSGQRIRISISNELALLASNQTAEQTDFSGLIHRAIFALIGMFLLGMIAALIFAKQLTTPIKKLAIDTKKMARLEMVEVSITRHDEIGTLTEDVHSMYQNLKLTISKLEEELIRVRDMQEAQRYFFSAASHELKTPITATSVLLEGMIANIGDFKNHPKYLRECLRLMETQNKTISEILELVKLEESTLTPEPQWINIRETVKAVSSYYQTISDANQLHMHMDICPANCCYVDEDMFKKVISNIVANAVQNTPATGEVKIWSEQLMDHVRICILNTPVTLSGEHVSKLFDPFYRVDKARTRKDGRSGLGLTIVKKTLDAMGCDYQLIKRNDGILFWFDVPRLEK